MAFSIREVREYHAATVALRVLRLIAVASIFALVLTVRTIAPIHASSGDPTDEVTPVVDPSPTDPAEEPPIDPPPLPDPPTEPPPADTVEPPPVDPVEPNPTEPPPADTSGTIDAPIDPPATEESPPADIVVEPAPTDPPPADILEVEPPTEAPVEAEPPPGEAIEPSPTEPPADPTDTVVPPSDEAELPPADPVEPVPEEPLTDALPPTLEDPSAVIDDPAGSYPTTVYNTPSVPSTNRSAIPVARSADNQAQTAAEVVTAIDSGETKYMDSDDPGHPMGIAPAIAAGGLAAGIAITNHAPSSVAVAMEFGRAGGGWAGALVFNLWLRRQMRERRMSQRRLADLAGVDHSTISRLLRQDRRPSLSTATKLASALKQVTGEGAEPEAADYFERIPEETVFPARRVELALRGDDMLNDDQVRRLMNIYLEARRRNQASAPNGSVRSRAAPARAAPDGRR